MKLLVFGYGGESTLAVSNILLNLSKEMVRIDDLEIILFGYGRKKQSESISDQLRIVSIKDPFRKGSLSKYRFVRKIDAILKKDCLCLSWKEIYKRALSIFKDESFDCVIGASGYFMYMEAAYQFAKKTNTKFGALYFDPFVNNVGSTNANKRKTIESKWYEYASFVLYESHSRKLELSDYKKIVHSYSIPIFEHACSINKNGPIIYGGTFYKNLRNPEVLQNFINKDICKNEKFEIYSNVKKFAFKNNNATAKGYISSDDFYKACSESKALIVIGNHNAESIVPSKVLEAISFKKPIIGINAGGAFRILEKYKFFFDANDPQIINKINSITQEEVDAFNISSSYPDRNPTILAKLILNLIKN